MLHSAGQYIGLAFANFSNLFDQAIVILSGGLIEAGSLLLTPLELAVRENTIKNNLECQIEISSLGTFGAAMGAAILSGVCFLPHLLCS